MNAQERGIFDELIASLESGEQAKGWEYKVGVNALTCEGPFGYVPPPCDPMALDDIREPCPPEES